MTKKYQVARKESTVEAIRRTRVMIEAMELRDRRQRHGYGDKEDLQHEKRLLDVLRKVHADS